MTTANEQEPRTEDWRITAIMILVVLQVVMLWGINERLADISTSTMPNEVAAPGWLVTGAGDDSFNGQYTHVGVYNGRALYTCTGGAEPRYLYWSSSGYWALGPAAPAECEIDEYSCTGPPTSPWTELGGLTPAPTLKIIG